MDIRNIRREHSLKPRSKKSWCVSVQCLSTIMVILAYLPSQHVLRSVLFHNCLTFCARVNSRRKCLIIDLCFWLWSPFLCNCFGISLLQNCLHWNVFDRPLQIQLYFKAKWIEEMLHTCCIKATGCRGFTSDRGVEHFVFTSLLLRTSNVPTVGNPPPLSPLRR